MNKRETPSGPAPPSTAFGNSLGSRHANINGEFPYGDAPKGPHLQKTTEVRSYSANDWWIYDMHGNVAEWVADVYDQKLPGGQDPTGPRKGFIHTIRGGSWFNDGVDARSASRIIGGPAPANAATGFREVLSPVPAGAG